VPRREAWIDLPEPYSELKMLVWQNYPRRLNYELASRDAGRILNALKTIMLGHNNWQSADGVPLPPTSEQRFWDDVSDELVLAVFIVLGVEVGKFMDSMRARSGR
jgi:hypothetical protein